MKSRWKRRLFFIQNKFMSTILDMIKRVQAFDVEAVTVASMEEVAPDITKRQREQMKQGLNAEGERIGRYRNPDYARMKHAMNAVPGLGNVDLKLTGEFSREIYTEIRGDQVIIDSTNEKTNDLAKKYGEVIFGLNSDTKAELIDQELQPVFMKHVRNALKL